VLETPHALVGAAIAVAIPNPVIALPLAFASHFVLDMVPHWNPHLNTELKTYGHVTKKSRNIVIFDVLVALVSGFFLATQYANNTAHTITILLGAFAAVLPDVIEGPYFFLNYKNKFIDRWLTFQKAIQVDTDPLPGLTTQIATIIACFWWVIS
jgi:hypothetical protein